MADRSLSIQQEKFVAAYIGEANGNATEAARIAGYSGSYATLRSIGSENLTKPNIASAIEELRQEIRAKGIAAQQNRIDDQNRRWELLKQVRRERGADPFYADVPGGSTGLMIKRIKKVQHKYDKDPSDPNSKPTQFTEELFEVELDTGMLKAFNDLEHATATELGQLPNKATVEHTGADGQPLTVTVIRDHPPGER